MAEFEAIGGGVFLNENFEYWRRYPDKFIEEVLGIKLLPFQKAFLRYHFFVLDNHDNHASLMNKTNTYATTNAVPPLDSKGSKEIEEADEEAMRIVDAIDFFEICKKNNSYAVGGGAIDAALTSLKNQNKYRWHDLRSDPNDLPSGQLDNLIMVKLWLWGDSDFGECDYECAYYGADSDGESLGWRITPDRPILWDKAIAWKEVELFEEDTMLKTNA